MAQWGRLSRSSPCCSHAALTERCDAELRCACSSRRGHHGARTVSALALLIVLAFETVPCADAHGWIAVPAARNLVHLGEQGFWQQMSLNRWVRDRA